MLKTAPYPLDVLIRMHFDPTSLEASSRRGGFCQSGFEGLAKDDDRFRLHFHALRRWGGPNDRRTPVFSSAADEQAAIDKLIDEALAAGCSPAQFAQCRRDAALGESGHSDLLCGARERLRHPLGRPSREMHGCVRG